VRAHLGALIGKPGVPAKLLARPDVLVVDLRQAVGGGYACACIAKQHARQETGIQPHLHASATHRPAVRARKRPGSTAGDFCQVTHCP